MTPERVVDDHAEEPQLARDLVRGQAHCPEPVDVVRGRQDRHEPRDRPERQQGARPQNGDDLVAERRHPEEVSGHELAVAQEKAEKHGASDDLGARRRGGVGEEGRGGRREREQERDRGGQVARMKEKGCKHRCGAMLVRHIATGQGAIESKCSH